MTKLERLECCDGCRWRSRPGKGVPRCTNLDRLAKFARACSTIEQCLVWEAKQ